MATQGMWRARAAVRAFLIAVVLVEMGALDGVRADLENHWSFYYESPCCGHDRRIRHHKDHLREFSCGRLYYRTFYLDEKQDVLYVGAMDRLFRLNLSNISHSNCEKDAMMLEPSDVANCVSKGKSEHFDCRNHIRVIQPMDDSHRLYVCGTNAHNPRDWVINRNLTHLPRHQYVPGVGLGTAKCPYDPADNSTALWVSHGNPADLPGLYTGTNAEFTKADTVIFRTDLHNMTTGRREFSFRRTLKYDSKWLDKPNFVGSYDVGEYVFFFFRETAVEYINCGKSVFSRVARVCKKDKGGKNILNQNWATYLKARLNCSLPGEFPFYFNEIQSVYRVAGDSSRFYGVFTTNSNGLTGSAICVFTVEDIQEAFRGKFKEQASSSSAWLPVQSTKVPEPRPGECVNNTETLPDTVLNFIRSHPLMDSAVAHEHGRPVFVQRDVVFTRLAVHRVAVETLNGRAHYTVYYVGTDGGQVYKIVQWHPVQPGTEASSALLDVWDVTPGEAIRLMDISIRHGALYVTSDSRVRQLDLVVCTHRYDSCVRCVRDPYCGWDAKTSLCKTYMPDLLQDVPGSNASICDGAVPKKNLVVTWGQSIHLSCFIKLPEVLKNERISWYYSSPSRDRHQHITYRADKYIETADKGLVLLAANEADSGRFECRLGGSATTTSTISNAIGVDMEASAEDEPLRQEGALLCSFNLTVDAHRCGAPARSQDYIKVYADWCNQFNKFKAAMHIWEKRQAQCSLKHNNSINQQNLQGNEITPVL